MIAQMAVDRLLRHHLLWIDTTHRNTRNCGRRLTRCDKRSGGKQRRPRCVVDGVMVIVVDVVVMWHWR